MQKQNKLWEGADTQEDYYKGDVSNKTGKKCDCDIRDCVCQPWEGKNE